MVSLNDNDGRLFHFERLQSRPNAWVVPNELHGEWLGARRTNESAEVGLASSKTTDLLLLRVVEHPEGIDLDPTGPGALYARAACYSWGHLLRRAVCSHLDIEPRELDVNIRPVGGPAAAGSRSTCSIRWRTGPAIVATWGTPPFCAKR